MARGKVKFFNDLKGYGFIHIEGEPKDVFVHYTGINGTGRRTLKEDDVVEFDIVEGKKGPQADGVVVV